MKTLKTINSKENVLSTSNLKGGKGQIVSLYCYPKNSVGLVFDAFGGEDKIIQQKAN